MNGQGPNTQPGFPDRPRQQRPKFNFNSRDVKREITPDFMASQLASFGSSAKLKSLPGQPPSNPSKQQQQQMGPGFGQGFGPGFPQMNQGFRQQAMPQNMGFQGQAFMQPQMQYNMQSMPGQFSTGPNNASFSMTGPQPSSFGMTSQPQPTPFGMTSQPQPTPFGMPAQAQPTPFGMPAQAQPTPFGMPAQAQPTPFGMPAQPKQTFNSPSPHQGSGDMFNSFNQATVSTKPSTASGFDPFSNLRSTKQESSSSDPFKSTSTLPAQPAASQEFDAFGAKPFAANIGPSTQSASLVPQPDTYSGFDSLSGLSSHSSSSILSSKTPKPPAASVAPTVGDFSVFSSMSTSQPTPASLASSGFDSMFGSQQKPSVQKPSGIESSFPTSAPVSSAVKSLSQFESSFNPPLAAPKSEIAFDSVFSPTHRLQFLQSLTFRLTSAFPSTKPALSASTSAFGDAFTSPAPSSQNFGFESSFEPAPLSAASISSVFAPIASPINAFDDNFAAISSKGASVKPSTVPDSFGQMPFSAAAPSMDMFSTSSSSADIFTGGIKFPEPSQPSTVAKPQPPPSVDLFSAALAKQPIPTQPGGVDLFSSKPSVSSVSSVDKYSVFSALNTGFNEPSSDFSPFPPEPIYSQPQPPAKPEAPLQTFQGTDMFDDAFDPFGEKKPQPAAAVSQPNFDQFDVFSQLSTAKPPEVMAQENSGSGSIVRQRPSSKTPAMMVVLPPPAKAADRKKPPKPAPPSKPAPPFISKQPDLFSPSTAGAATGFPESAAVFDPFFNSSARLVASVNQRTRQVSAQPAPRRAKRRAPPPPTKQSSGGPTFYAGDKNKAVISLLDLDFNAPAVVSSGAPPPQPLLILPTADIMSKGAPPSRPPPPKSGDDVVALQPTFDGLAPPLPPRPGPGHILYHHVLKAGPYCVALFEFEAESSDELNFKAGDGIKLDSDLSDEWFAGSIGNRRGIFPKNCVEVKIPLPARSDTPAAIPSPARTLSPASSPSPIPDAIDTAADAGPKEDSAPKKDLFNAWGDSRTPSPPPIPSEPEPTSTPTPEPSPAPVPAPVPEPTPPELTPIGTCIAIYSFEAQESDELSIIEGGTVEVVEFVDDDWIKGRVGDQVGIFPRSYASFGDEEVEEEALEEILEEDTHSMGVFYDFEAGADDELSLTAGDMVKVISTVGVEWIKGRFGGKEGIFPACFVPAIPDHWNIPEDSETFTENFETTEESSSSSSSSSSDDHKDTMSEISDSRSYSAEPSSDLGRVEIIADFKAENDFEMSVNTGDIVKITARLNDLWLEGECHGNNGILPVNFVKWLDTTPEPDIIGNPAATDRLVLERQDTIKPIEEPKETEVTPAPLGIGFSECNPFAQEFGIGATPPTQEFGIGAPPPTQEFGIRATPPTQEFGIRATPPTQEFGIGAIPLTQEFGIRATPPTQEFGIGATPPTQESLTGDLPPPPTQEDLDQTLVHADNPFTADLFGDNVGVVETPSPSTPTTEPSVKSGNNRRALYEFTSVNDDELDFELGDIIKVTEFLNEDWLRGTCKGKEGLFPTSFTEEFPQS
ncbi:proline-rich protein 36-like isoform X2 [Bolinopsis microptera]|uniref:proline-rich protein 36-like isoform X2 n=1 Tax=Bolinopsis microptera TaxID=2820187 RepID=UPI003079D35E